MTEKKAGFIGIGAMGLPMVRNMVDRGYDVVAFDLSEKAVAAAADVGARTAATLGDLVGEAEVIVASLPNDAAMRGLAVEMVPFLRADHLLIVSGTHSIELMQEIAELFAPVGARVVDAPVVWGVIGAEEGTLVSFIGGQEEAVSRARTIVLGYGRDAEHLGHWGPVSSRRRATITCTGYMSRRTSRRSRWRNATASIRRGCAMC